MLQPKKSILDKSKLKTEKNFITNSNLSNDQKEKINNELLFNSNWYSNRKQVFDNTGKSQSINANSFIPSTSPKIELNNVYGELGSYTPKEDLIELNKKFQNRERGTVVHEDDHRRRRYSSMDDKINLISTPLRNSMTSEHANTFSTRNEKSQDVQYEYDPSEIHANIQNLRFYNNLKPDQYIDEETMKNIKIQEKQYLLEKFNSEEIRGMLNSTVYNDNSKNNIHFAAQGGYINQNTNMNRYAQGGNLTQFNTGGTHESSPIGGVPIGNNNSVEEGETKQNNFVYSNRIYLDENIVSQYNLPKSLVGKSVADATKFIDNKFKGRNDKISQSTKNGMLSKIAEAQESMKPQEPEMEQSQEGYSQEMMDNGQMALGGFADSTIGQGFGKGATGAQQSAAVGAGLGTLTAGLDLGMTAFGKPAQDTSGLAPSAKVNSGGMIAGSAMKGASAGMAFGPWGAGIGAVVGAGAGLLGAGKAKKAALKNSNNFAINTNRQFSDQYALGGEMDPPVKSNSILPLRPDEREQSMERYKLFRANAISRPSTSEYKPDLRSPEQIQMDYQYIRDSAKPGFNVDSGYRPNLTDPATAQLLYNKRRNKQFVLGGDTDSIIDPPTTGYGADGRFIKPKIQSWDDPITPFITPTSKQDLINYQLSKGLSKKDATGNLGTKTKAWIASDRINATPDTIDMSVSQQPFVEPTGVQAGYEKYYQDNKPVTKPSFGKRVWEGTKAVGKYGYENTGNIARYAPIAANAYQLSQLKKPQGERLERLGNRYKPSYVDMAQQQNIVNQELNNTNSAIQQSGASEGASRNAILGAQLNKTKALSNAYMNAEAQNRQQDDIAQQFNLGVDQTNLEQSNNEKDINARDQAAYRNAKREYITGIGEGIGDIGKEQTQKKIIAKTLGYKWDGTYVKDTDGNIVTDPETGKPMTEEKLKESQASKDKKALGGYLIKNRK